MCFVPNVLEKLFKCKFSVWKYLKFEVSNQSWFLVVSHNNKQSFEAFCFLLLVTDSPSAVWTEAAASSFLWLTERF